MVFFVHYFKCTIFQIVIGFSLNSTNFFSYFWDEWMLLNMHHKPPVLQSCKNITNMLCTHRINKINTKPKKKKKMSVFVVRDSLNDHQIKFHWRLERLGFLLFEHETRFQNKIFTISREHSKLRQTNSNGRLWPTD